jgi:hypothetical protein
MCVRIFIKMSTHIYISIYIYIIFLKKYKKLLITLKIGFVLFFFLSSFVPPDFVSLVSRPANGLGSN